MMTDKISDMIARINNAQRAYHSVVKFPHTKLLEAILEVLQKEGYIANFTVEGDLKKTITVSLKYYDGKPVISKFKRCSKPGRREYSKIKNLPKFHNGLGVYILSTSEGMKTDHEARQENIGGEVLCCIF